MGYFTDYPKHVFLILSNEFCERFSYYGMKAILVLYFEFALGFSETTSVSLYHTFNMLCYFTPILGAMMADGWLGKYKTILYVSMIYSLGNIIMTLTAIPINGEWIVWAPFIGLVIIAFGTGGIKPCVSAFGGDQFSATQERQKSSFFSLFYMAINIGSLLSTIITPLVRSNVECFGQECYAVAFGIPAILMIVAIVLFAIGSRWYTKVPPGESILVRMFGCIGTALKGKCGCGSKGPKEKKEHWLDYAEPKYEKSFISDVKDVMSVCWLFIPLPVFWALFDQQGSRWTQQAKNLKGDLGSVVIQPDMMPVMNSLLVVVMVPLLESLIYPCLDRFKIPNRPLQRMGWGMILAATAFLMTGFLQIAIDNESPAALSEGQIKYNFINPTNCQITVQPFDGSPPGGVEVPANWSSEYFYSTYDTSTILNYTSHCAGGATTGSIALDSTVDQTAYQILLSQNVQPPVFIQEKVDFTHNLEATIRVFNNLPYPASVYIDHGSYTAGFVNISAYNFSDYHTLHQESLRIKVVSQGTNGNNVSLNSFSGEAQNGAVYTLLLLDDKDTVDAAIQLTDISPRGINIFIQVPQYVVMTLGECLFSVTGLSFAYSQAAPSMKSILTAVWLLTVAIGNVIVIIIAEAGGDMKQMAEYFLFSGIMYITTFIFIIMCLFYKYVEPRTYEEPHSDSSSSTSDGSSESSYRKGKDNVAFSMDEEKAIESKKGNLDTKSVRSVSSSASSEDSDTKF